MVKRICESCKKEYKTKKTEKLRFCSWSCYQKSKPPTLTNCIVCGVRFQTLPNNIKKTKSFNYCSKGCFAKWQSKKIEKICQNCNIKFEVKLSLDKLGKNKFCSPKCSQESYRRFLKNPILRFMKKILILPTTNSCWIWVGSISRWGYGHFIPYSKKMSAHRFSYEYFRKPIIKGKFILHSCNIPCCVNPNHLREGDVKDNALDMLKSGRSCATLTDEQVLEILNSPQIKNCDFAKKLGVSKTVIQYIRKNKSYKHIPRSPQAN